MNGKAAATPDELHYIVYVSSATNPMTEPELIQLLEVCRRNNQPKGITGMLAYKEGVFIQALEGPRSELQKLRDVVARDPRHKAMQVVLEGPLQARAFGAWSMAFKNLAGVRPKDIPNYSEFLSSATKPLDFARWPHKSHRMLLAFREKM